MIERRAEPDQVRVARRRCAAGVSVVLTRYEDGFHGVTVSSFTVVSLDPPALLVCLHRDGRMSTLVPAVGHFTLSVLEERHEFVAERFAGRAPLVDARLTGVSHTLAASGLPILTGALAWFDCRVSALHDGGDHVILVGSIEHTGMDADTDAPLVYYEGRYRSLT